MRFFRALLALSLLTAIAGCESLTEPNAITIRKEPPKPKAPEPAPAAPAVAQGAAAAAPAMPAGGAAAPKAGGG